MAEKAHGRHTFISLDGQEVKCNTSTLERTRDKHDTTLYGADAHDYDPGLADGTSTLAGVYEKGATGAPTVLKDLHASGEKVPMIRRPEGTGAGLPEETATAFVEKYTESAPVADMVSWSCDLQLTSVITDGTQAP